MEDWPPQSGGGMDRTIYQNLVEMIPLMETFMEQKGNRRGFTRHASMVYTPAPVRKVSESPLKSAKKNKQQRAVTPKIEVEDAALWDEQENILRRVEKEEVVPEYEPQEKLDREALTELQKQIESLKQQLTEKDSLIRACEADARAEAAEAARMEELLELKANVEELQQSILQREQTARSLESQLTENQQELVKMESFVDRMQAELLKEKRAAEDMVSELNDLRLKVAAFQYQAEMQKIGEESVQDEEEEEIEEEEPSQQDEEEAKKVEAATKMYLGAVIAAKEKPGEESILLAAELRLRLQEFLQVNSAVFQQLGSYHHPHRHQQRQQVGVVL